jgi:hypothetical protein
MLSERLEGDAADSGVIGVFAMVGLHGQSTSTVGWPTLNCLALQVHAETLNPECSPNLLR